MADSFTKLTIICFKLCAYFRAYS